MCWTNLKEMSFSRKSSFLKYKLLSNFMWFSVPSEGNLLLQKKPTVSNFSYYARLGHFFNLLNACKRKYGARKLFQNKKKSNNKISKYLIIKGNTSGLLLPLPQKLFFTKFEISLSPCFFITETSMWEVFLGYNQKSCKVYRCSRATSHNWKTVSWEISFFN